MDFIPVLGELLGDFAVRTKTKGVMVANARDIVLGCPGTPADYTNPVLDDNFFQKKSTIGCRVFHEGLNKGFSNLSVAMKALSFAIDQMDQDSILGIITYNTIKVAMSKMLQEVTTQGIRQDVIVTFNRAIFFATSIDKFYRNETENGRWEWEEPGVPNRGEGRKKTELQISHGSMDEVVRRRTRYAESVCLGLYGVDCMEGKGVVSAFSF